ncbi:hypothetical protein DENSPDRAFT_887249 [Dentipellis sp. KUC8613]|nr:hypothetical protein DENSPDRAFT_887249 [Dentipellis sp. KUC8613]
MLPSPHRNLAPAQHRSISRCYCSPRASVPPSCIRCAITPLVLLASSISCPRTGIPRTGDRTGPRVTVDRSDFECIPPSLEPPPPSLALLLHSPCFPHRPSNGARRALYAIPLPCAPSGRAAPLRPAIYILSAPPFVPPHNRSMHRRWVLRALATVNDARPMPSRRVKHLCAAPQPPRAPSLRPARHSNGIGLVPYAVSLPRGPLRRAARPCLAIYNLRAAPLAVAAPCPP